MRNFFARAKAVLEDKGAEGYVDTSIIMSPFASLDQSEFLLFCGINSLVSLLIIMVVVIVNISSFVELSNRKRRMLGLIVQVCTTIFICLVSCHCAEQVINALYNFF